MSERPWYRCAGFVASLLLATVGVVGTSLYANLSYDVTDPDDYADFPPFKAGHNANHNDHLGGEYLKIAEALVAGRGYADPFGTPTGPTAWMPPPLTLFQAALLDYYDLDRVAVANVVIACQALTLWLTAVLTLVVAWRWAPRVPGVVVVALMALGLITRFHTAFQVTHDSWLVLLALDGLVAFALWGHFPSSTGRSIVWGVGGGLAALVSPVLGACWVVLTVAETRRLRPLGVAAFACALTVSPWVARNAVVFDRFIPVKSNLAYELYQSQLLCERGRLSDKVFSMHPYATHGAERAEYAALGEIEFLDRKGRAFTDDVSRRPSVFAGKVADRFLAATLDYSPMDPKEAERKELTALCEFAHPLPFLAACGLLLLAPVVRLPRAYWVTLAVLAVYLAPYVLVSYYERYEFPLWGLKTLAIVWLLDVLLGLAAALGGRIRARRLEDRPAAATLAPPGVSSPAGASTVTRMTLALAASAVGFALSAAAADPKQDPRLLDEFSVTDAGGRAVFTREADGFRVKAPRNPFDALYAAKGLYRRNVWDIVTSYAVGGDFEYVVKYEVAKLGEPGKPAVAETNAEIAIDNRGRDGLVALNVNSKPGDPKCFRTMRVFPGSAGTHFNMTTFPRKSDAGRLAIRRVGSELSLLVADGANEPLVELVRYPHDPRGSPNLRVSAYQGQEATRGPVDVLLSDIAIRADKVVRGPAAREATPPATPRASYPVAIDYTRNPAAILTDFNQTNDTAKAFRVEGDGLRVQPPVLPAHKKDANAYWLRDSRYSLHGDFEFAVKYDLAQLGPVGKESGYRTASVSLGVETAGPLGSVSLSRGLSGDTTQRFSVTHYSPTKAGPQWDTQTFPASAKSGRLAIRRVGSEMSFWAAEGDGPERLLVRRPWDSKPVPRIRLNADQGGTPVTPVNVLLTGLTVRAESLTDLQSGAPIGPPPRPAGDDPSAETVVFEGAPVEKSKKFRNLGLAALAAAATLTAAGAALLLRRRGRAASP